MSLPSKKSLSRARGAAWLRAGPLPVPGLCDIVAGYNFGPEGVLRHTLGLPRGARVYALAPLKGGRLLATGLDSGVVLIWDAAEGICLRTLEGHTNIVFALAALEGGRHFLASGSEDYTIRLWSEKSDARDLVLVGHEGGVFALAPLEGHRLASGARDNTVRVWDTLGGACLLRLEGHTNSVLSLARLPEGFLASGSWDGAIRLWDTTSGACRSVLAASIGPVMALAVMPDGRLASALPALAHGSIRFWEVTAAGATLVDAADLPRPGYVESLLVLKSGLLVSGSNSSEVQLWAGKLCLLTMKLLGGIVLALAELGEGDQIASSFSGGTVAVWD